MRPVLSSPFAARSRRRAAPVRRGRAPALGLFAAALLVAGCSEAPDPLASREPVAIMDRQGHAEPMVAGTIEIPKGWSTEGGILWNPVDCALNSVQTRWRATSPDGRYAVEMMPGLDWQVRGMTLQLHPCPTTPMNSARDYLVVIAGQLRPGAQVVAYRDRPDLAAKVVLQAPPPGSPPSRQWADAGELMLSYGLGDTPMRETLTASLRFSEMNAGGRPFRAAYTAGALAVRGPDKAIDAGFAEQVRESLKIDDRWAQATTQQIGRMIAAFDARQKREIATWHAQQMAAINARGAADRARIRSQTMAEIGRINAQGWASRQDSLDRMHRDNIDTIREVNRYHDPVAGRTVELSSHQDHGWRLDNGSHLSTNDPNFDPGALFGIGGQEMQRVR